MSRQIVSEKDRTTIVASKKLLERVVTHIATTGESQTEFITRALVNQLENDGDLSIREEIAEEKGEE